MTYVSYNQTYSKSIESLTIKQTKKQDRNPPITTQREGTLCPNQKKARKPDLHQSWRFPMRSPEIIHENLVQLNLHSLFLPCFEPAVPFLRQTWQLPFSLRINEHFPTNQMFSFSRNCGDVSIGKWKTKMWHGTDKGQNFHLKETTELFALTKG